MKSIRIIIALFLLSMEAVVAQTPQISFSDPFEEPPRGWNKLLQLKNGNTFYFYFNKTSFKLTVFDKEHKLIARKVLPGRIGNSKELTLAGIIGIFEMDGHPVVFLRESLYEPCPLFRIIFDGNTGNVLQNQKIDGPDSKETYVCKDPKTDNYAIVRNVKMEKSDGNVKTLFTYYKTEDTIHRETLAKEIEMGSGDPYTVDAKIDEQGNAFIFTWMSSNRRKSNDRLIISRVNTTSGDVLPKEIDAVEPMWPHDGIIQLDPSNHNIYLLTTGKIKSKSDEGYSSLLRTIDPATLSVTSSKNIPVNGANQYAKRKLGMDGFDGVPQNLVMNIDGSMSILLEDFGNRSVTYGSTSINKTNLNSIAVVDVEPSGNEKNAIVFPKEQLTYDYQYPLYPYRWDVGPWEFAVTAAMLDAVNKPFISFDYISTPQSRYVLYNDLPENFEKTPGKMKRVLHFSDASTFCYKLKDDGTAEKFFLFGKQDADNQTRFCYLNSSHYSKENNTYAVLMIQRNGREKKAKIAWIQFD